MYLLVCTFIFSTSTGRALRKLSVQYMAIRATNSKPNKQAPQSWQTHLLGS